MVQFNIYISSSWTNEEVAFLCKEYGQEQYIQFGGDVVQYYMEET